jgi:hypothetical protein
VVAAKMILIVPNSTREIIDMLFEQLQSERYERKQIAFRLVVPLILRRVIKAGNEAIHY